MGPPVAYTAGHVLSWCTTPSQSLFESVFQSRVFAATPSPYRLVIVTQVTVGVLSKEKQHLPFKEKKKRGEREEVLASYKRM